MLSTDMLKHQRTTDSLVFWPILKLWRQCHTPLRMQKIGSDFYDIYTQLRNNAVALKVTETKIYLLVPQQFNLDSVAEGYKQYIYM